jgi:hypothetical protein
MLENYVNIDYFNNALVKGGGDPILTKKKIVTMRHFISILLKLFKQNYDLTRSKARSRQSTSGGATYLGDYSNAVYFKDLNYSLPYQNPTVGIVDRSFF